MAQAGNARRGRGAHLAALVAVGALAGGCGSTAPADSVALRAPCARSVLNVVAHDARVAPAAIAATSFTTTSGAPACRYRSHGVNVEAVVDSAPQALFRLQKQAEEYSQGVLWFHLPEQAYPSPISGLGVAAFWFPAKRLMLTTDRTRLISVTIDAGGGRAPERAASDAARAYLGLSR